MELHLTWKDGDSLHVYLGDLFGWGGFIESNLSDLTEQQTLCLDRVICKVKQINHGFSSKPRVYKESSKFF